jgi:hypothetical protein
MQLSEKTQQAYREYEAAKKARREVAATIKDAKKDDDTLVDLEATKKQAAADYKAEAGQFQAKHARLFEQLDAAKAEEKEAKALFDELYVQASAESIAQSGAVQLSLFADDGRKINVELVTKISVEKSHPQLGDEAVQQLQEDAEEIADSGEGFHTTEELVAALSAQDS